MKVLASVLVALALCGFAVVLHAAAENVVHIKLPASGEHVVVPCGGAKRIIFDFAKEDASFDLSKNNIVIHYRNGATVTLEGLLPADGNLDNVGDVSLQFGQNDLLPPLREFVMILSDEIEPAPGPSAKP